MIALYELVCLLLFCLIMCAIYILYNPLRSNNLTAAVGKAQPIVSPIDLSFSMVGGGKGKRVVKTQKSNKKIASNVDKKQNSSSIQGSRVPQGIYPPEAIPGLNMKVNRTFRRASAMERVFSKGDGDCFVTAMLNSQYDRTNMTLSHSPRDVLELRKKAASNCLAFVTNSQYTTLDELYHVVYNERRGHVTRFGHKTLSNTSEIARRAFGAGLIFKVGKEDAFWIDDVTWYKLYKALERTTEMGDWVSTGYAVFFARVLKVNLTILDAVHHCVDKEPEGTYSQKVKFQCMEGSEIVPQPHKSLDGKDCDGTSHLRGYQAKNMVSGEGVYVYEIAGAKQTVYVEHNIFGTHFDDVSDNAVPGDYEALTGAKNHFDLLVPVLAVQTSRGQTTTTTNKTSKKKKKKITKTLPRPTAKPRSKPSNNITRVAIVPRTAKPNRAPARKGNVSEPTWDSHNNNKNKQRQVRDIDDVAQKLSKQTPSNKKPNVGQNPASPLKISLMESTEARITLSPSKQNSSLVDSEDESGDDDNNNNNKNNMDATFVAPDRTTILHLLTNLKETKKAKALVDAYRLATDVCYPGSKRDKKKYKKGKLVGALQAYVSDVLEWVIETKWTFKASTRIALEMSSDDLRGPALVSNKNKHTTQLNVDQIIAVMNNVANAGGIPGPDGELYKPNSKFWMMMFDIGKDRVSQFVNFVDQNPNTTLLVPSHKRNSPSALARDVDTYGDALYALLKAESGHNRALTGRKAADFLRDLPEKGKKVFLRSHVAKKNEQPSKKQRTSMSDNGLRTSECIVTVVSPGPVDVSEDRARHILRGLDIHAEVLSSKKSAGSSSNESQVDLLANFMAFIAHNETLAEHTGKDEPLTSDMFDLLALGAPNKAAYPSWKKLLQISQDEAIMHCNELKGRVYVYQGSDPETSKQGKEATSSTRVCVVGAVGYDGPPMDNPDDDSWSGWHDFPISLPRAKKGNSSIRQTQQENDVMITRAAALKKAATEKKSKNKNKNVSVKDTTISISKRVLLQTNISSRPAVLRRGNVLRINKKAIKEQLKKLITHFNGASIQCGADDSKTSLPVQSPPRDNNDAGASKPKTTISTNRALFSSPVDTCDGDGDGDAKMSFGDIDHSDDDAGMADYSLLDSAMPVPNNSAENDSGEKRGVATDFKFERENWVKTNVKCMNGFFAWTVGSSLKTSNAKCHEDFSTWMMAGYVMYLLSIVTAPFFLILDWSGTHSVPFVCGLSEDARTQLALKGFGKINKATLVEVAGILDQAYDAVNNNMDDTRDHIRPLYYALPSLVELLLWWGGIERWGVPCRVLKLPKSSPKYQMVEYIWANLKHYLSSMRGVWLVRVHPDGSEEMEIIDKLYYAEDSAEHKESKTNDLSFRTAKLGPEDCINVLLPQAASSVKQSTYRNTFNHVQKLQNELWAETDTELCQLASAKLESLTKETAKAMKRLGKDQKANQNGLAASFPLLDSGRVHSKQSGQNMNLKSQ